MGLMAVGQPRLRITAFQVAEGGNRRHGVTFGVGKGVSNFCNVGVEHNVTHANHIEYVFVEVEYK